MKPLTISDFSFTIKKSPSTAVPEPPKKPEVKEAKPPEPAIDTSKLTDEQAEKFKGLLAVDPENAQDITVEEYIALAESMMTFKEETIEGYNRYQDDRELHHSQLQLELKVRFGHSNPEDKAVPVFEKIVTDMSARDPAYQGEGLRLANHNQEVADQILDSEYLSKFQRELMAYLKESGKQLVDENA